MRKQPTYYILLCLFVLAAAAVLGGGMFWVAYHASTPLAVKVLKKIPASQPTTDPEFLVDDAVQAAGDVISDTPQKDENGEPIPTRAFVHYRTDNGTYEKIDTSVVASTQEGKAYENTTNLFKSYFSGQTTSESTVEYRAPQDRAVSFAFVDARDSQPVVKGDQITYPNIYDHVDARYTEKAGSLLEEVIVNSPSELTEVTQQIWLDGLYYKMQPDGSLTFHDSASKKIVFETPAPVMYELNSQDHRSTDLSLQITEEDGKYYLHKVINQAGQDWMAQATYPIVVDVSLGIVPPSLNILGVTSFLHLADAIGKLNLTIWDQSLDEDGWMIQRSADGSSWSDTCQLPTGSASGTCGTNVTYTCPSGWVPTKTTTGGACNIVVSNLVGNTTYYFRAMSYGTPYFGTRPGTDGVLLDTNFGTLQDVTTDGTYIYAVGFRIGSNGIRITKYNANSGAPLQTIDHITDTDWPALIFNVAVDGDYVYLIGRRAGVVDSLWVQKRPKDLTQPATWTQSYAITYTNTTRNNTIYPKSYNFDSTWLWVGGGVNYEGTSGVQPILFKIDKSTGLMDASWHTIDNGGWHHYGHQLGARIAGTSGYCGSYTLDIKSDLANNIVFFMQDRGGCSPNRGYTLVAWPISGGSGYGLCGYDGSADTVYAKAMDMDLTNNKLYIVGQDSTSSVGWVRRQVFTPGATCNFNTIEATLSEGGFGWSTSWEDVSINPGTDEMYVTGRTSSLYWSMQRRSASNLNAYSWIVNNFQTAGSYPRHTLDTNYIYTYGYPSSGTSLRIEKRKRVNGTLGNYQCAPPNIGPPGFLWPNCFDSTDYGYSSPTFRRTVASPVTSAPTVAAGGWNRLSISNMSTVTSPNDAQTDLCIGVSYNDPAVTNDDWIESGAKRTRYVGSLGANALLAGPDGTGYCNGGSNSGNECFVDSDCPSSFCARFGLDTIDRIINSSPASPASEHAVCILPVWWSFNNPQSIYSSALPTPNPQVQLYPNTKYTVGMFSRMTKDIYASEGEWITAPTATASAYTTPRQVVAPTVQSIAPSLNVVINRTPVDNVTYTNPAYTDYSIKVTTLNRWVTPGTGALSTSEQWGDYDASAGNATNFGGASGVTLNDALVTPATCYQFSVRSRTEEAPTTYAADSAATTAICTAPTVPTVSCISTRCTATTILKSGMYYTWERRTCDITGATCGSWTAVSTCSSSYSIIDNNPATVCGPSTTRYEYRVKVSNVAGCGTNSDWSVWNPPSATRTQGWDTVPPCAVTNIRAFAKSASSINFTWDWTQATHGGERVDSTPPFTPTSSTHYSYRVFVSGQPLCYASPIGESNRTCLFTGLSPNVPYSATVLDRDAYNRTGTSAISSPIYTLANTPTLTLTCGYTGSGCGSGTSQCQVTVGRNLNPLYTEYYLETSTDGSNWSDAPSPYNGWLTIDYLGNGNKISFNEACGITAYFRVTARNGDGDLTNTVTRSSATPSCGPSAPTVSGQTTNSLTWSWNPVAGATSYNVYRDTGTTAIYSGTNTSYPDGGRSTNTQYGVCVRAVVGGVEGVPSNVTKAYTSIEPVTGVSFSNVTTTGMDINASPSVYTNLSTPNSGLQFIQDGVPLGWINVVTIHPTLTPNTRYCYQAQSRNADAVAYPDPDTNAPAPSPSACQYTRAATPKAPRLIRQTSETLVNIIINNTDDNWGNPTSGQQTEYALCVTKYDPAGNPLYAHYYNPVTDSLDHDCSNPDYDTQPDCVSHGGTWTPQPSCATGDGSGYWAVRSSYDDDNGKMVDLVTAGKYDFKLKARSGSPADNGSNCSGGAYAGPGGGNVGQCLETAFGSQATLFLVKNNLVGWAWSSKVGWISMNCLNQYNQPDYSCNQAGDWGVNTWFEPSRDVNPLEGYAWSSSGQALSDVFNADALDLNNSAPNGVKAIAYDDGVLWVARVDNTPDKLLYKTDPTKIDTGDDPIIQTFPITDGLIRLIDVNDANYLWGASSTTGALYRIKKSDGTFDQTVALSGSAGQMGMAYDGTDIFVPVPGTNDIARVRVSHDASPSVEVDCNGSAPGLRCTVGNAPQQTYFDGRYIWVNNYNGPTGVSRIDRITGVVKTFNLPAGSYWARGIAYDGTNWWVSYLYSDGVNSYGRLAALQVDANDNGTWVATINMPDNILAGNANANAQLGQIDYDGTFLWVAGFYSNRIYQFRPATRQIVGEYVDDNNPFLPIHGGGYEWVGNHVANGHDQYLIQFSKKPTAQNVGIGWLSFNKNVCSDNYQKGCSTVQANSPECGGTANCVASAGTPPDGTTYGFCYTDNTVTGVKYGTCSDNNQPCSDGNLSLCADPLNAACVWESCQNPGSSCSNYGSGTEVCRDTATANFNGTTREIEGWGRILSQATAGSALGFGDWGWLNMSGTYDDGKGNTGTFTTTGTEVDSQEFFGDPDVNPDDLKLYSMFGWGWNAQTSDYSSVSAWLPMTNVSDNQKVLHNKYTDKAQLQIDQQGNQHVAWIGYDDATAKYQAYYVKRVNGEWQTISGATYTGNATVANARVTDSTDVDASAPPDGVMMFSFVLDSSNIPHFAWQDGGGETYREGGAVKYTTWDGSAWTTTTVEATDAQAPTIALDAGGQPHIVYRQGGYGVASIIQRQWNGSAWVSITGDANNLNVSTAGVAVSWPHFVLRSGVPVVVWSQTDGGDDNIYLRWWDATANAGAGGWVDIDPGDGNYSDDQILNTGINAPAKGYFPLIALYPDGHPGVLWRDGGNDGDHLYFRQWNVSSGQWLSVSNDGNNQQVDVNRMLHVYGRQDDLAIDPSGHPIVTFSTEEGASNTRIDVYVAKWSGSQWATAKGTAPTGSGNGQTDPLYNVSSSTSSWSENPVVALDRFGNPYIVWTEMDLSSVECSSFGPAGTGQVLGSQPAPYGNNFGLITYSITGDDQYLYGVGYALNLGTPSNGWYIEKRQLNDGSLVNAFGTNGYITEQMGTYGWARGVAVDATYMYIVGENQNEQQRIEKRNKTTGALCDGVGACAAGAFDGDGIIDLPAAGEARDVKIDGTYMYVVSGTFGGSALRIDKRRLDTGAIVYTITQDYGTGAYDGAAGIAIDNTYMYVAGADRTDTDGRWVVDKRYLDNGAYVTAFGSGSGYVTSNPTSGDDEATDIAYDGTYLYVSGYDDGGNGGRLRIEKRDPRTGELITTFGGQNGDPAGVITVDVTTNADMIHAISVDHGSLFIAAEQCLVADCSNRGWYLEKRHATDGSLCTTANPCDGAGWGAGGSGTVSDAAGNDHGWVAQDVYAKWPYVYFSGEQVQVLSNAFRADKRSSISGDLVATASSDLCTPLGYGTCVDVHAIGMRCANIDVEYSRWTPGVSQGGVGWVEFMPAGALLGIPWVQTMFANVHASQNITLAPPPRGTGDYTATYLIESGGAITGIPGYYGGTTTGAPTSQLPEQPGFTPLIQNQPSVQTLGRDLLDKLDVNGLVTITGNGKNRSGALVIAGTGTDISQSTVFDNASTGSTHTNPILNNAVYYFHGQPLYRIDSPMMFMRGNGAVDPATHGNGVIVIDGDLEINADMYYEKRCSNTAALCTDDGQCGAGGSCQDPSLTNLIELPSAVIIVRGNIYISSLVSKVSSVVVALDNPSTTTVSEGIVSTGRRAPQTYAISRSQDDTWVDSNFSNRPTSNSAFFGKDNDVLISVTSGSASSIYESQPGSETWNLGNIPAGQGAIVTMMKASNGDIYLGRSGITFSEGYVNRSSDSGQTWVTSNNFGNCPITTLVEAPNHDVFAGMGCNKAYVYRLPSGASITTGWVNTASGSGAIDFSGTQADVVRSLIRASNGDIIAGTADSTGGRVYRLSYIGPLWDNKWNQIENRTFGTSGVSALAQMNNGDIFAGTNVTPAAVYRLPNGTSTWVNTGALRRPGGAYREQALQDVAQVNALFKASTGVLFAGTGGNYGDVFRYNSGANTWELTTNMTVDPTPGAQYSGDEVYPRAVYVLSEGASNTLYAGTQVVFNTSTWSGEVYKTTDWGVTWERVYNTLVGGTSVNTLLQNALDLGGTKYRSYMRFPLNIPSGSEIKSAYLRVQSDGSGTGDFNARIYLMDTDNANTVDFTTNPNGTLYDYAISNSVNFPITGVWSADTWYTSPDLKNIVQRFVNKDNYAQGNYLGLSIREGDASVGQSRGVRTYNSSVDNAPQLVIEYAPRRTLYEPSAGTDDVVAWSSGSDSGATSMRVGWNSSQSRAERSFLRLGPVAGYTTLPAEAEILKARLAVTKDAANTDAADFQARQALLSGTNPNGDFDAFSGNPYSLGLNLNVAEVAETVTGAWSLAGPSTYRFSDISRLIQNWVDDSRYTPGFYLGLRVRRGDNEDVATAGASRSFLSEEGSGSTRLEIDYQIPLSVSGLFVAETGYNFDRKYTKNLAPAEQILYDGRVVANTPPGLADFTQALPVYHRVTP